MQLALTSDPFAGVRIAQVRTTPDAPWVDATLGAPLRSYYTYESALEGVRELAARERGTSYVVTAPTLPGTFFSVFELDAAGQGWTQLRELRPTAPGLEFAPRLVSAVIGDSATVIHPVERI